MGDAPSLLASNAVTPFPRKSSLGCFLGGAPVTFRPSSNCVPQTSRHRQHSRGLRGLAAPPRRPGEAAASSGAHRRCREDLPAPTHPKGLPRRPPEGERACPPDAL